MAYPFILQLMSALSNTKKKMDRIEDSDSVPKVICKYLNSFIDQYDDYIETELKLDLQNTSFLFGGWSWRRQEFFIRKIFYDFSTLKRYVHRDTGLYGKYGVIRRNKIKVTSIGDYTSYFNERVYEILKARSSAGPFLLDNEPMEVLCGMLHESKFTNRRQGNLYEASDGQKIKSGLIGGIPQMVKVYPFSRSIPLGIRARDGRLYDMGRPIEANERLERPIFDLATFSTRPLTPSHAVGNDSLIPEEEGTG